MEGDSGIKEGREERREGGREGGRKRGGREGGERKEEKRHFKLLLYTQPHSFIHFPPLPRRQASSPHR